MRRATTQHWVGLSLALTIASASAGGAQEPKATPRKPTPGRGGSLPSRGLDTRTRLDRGSAPRLLYGNVPLPIPAAVRAPFLDPTDGHPCLAAESLRSLGIDARPDPSTRAVLIRVPGTSRTVTVPARIAPPGRDGLFVRLADIARGTGSQFRWDPVQRTGSLLATLEETSLLDGSLVLRTSLPVVPKLTAEGNRVVVELPGTAPRDPQTDPKLESEHIQGVRIDLPDAQTTRLAFETNRPADFAWGALPDGRQIVVGIGVADQLKRLADARSLPERIDPSTISAPLLNLTVAPGALRANAALRTIRVASNSTRFEMHMEAKKLPSVRPRLEPGRLTLDFPETGLAQSAVESLGDVGHPLVKSATIDPLGDKGARLSLELVEPARYTLRLDPKTGIRLNLAPLSATDSVPLAGKTIVVDPGHGGERSPGARGVDGRWEKHHTLPMGRMLAEELEALGANVVLTRDSDSDPGLLERGPIANRTSADLFVSVHCNHAGRNRAVNGAIVFYHGPSSVCRQLAESITERLRAEVGAIKTQPPRSDRTVYKSGFAVLRKSAMAGVLVETGFLSSPKDAAALRNPDVQRQIARSVATGLLDFLLSNPDTDTRNVKPQKDGGPVIDPEEEPDLPPSFLPDLPPPPPADDRP